MLAGLLLLVSLCDLVTSEAAHYPAPAPPTYCPAPQACVPPVLCPTDYLASLYDPASSCYLAPGTPGICCKGHPKSCEYCHCQAHPEEEIFLAAKTQLNKS